MSSPLSQENINPESQPQSPQCPINAQASPTLTCPIELDTKSDTAVPESPSPEENPPHQPSLSPLQNFYHASVTQSRIQLFISSVLILTLVYFQVNFFVIAFVLWCSSFHISRTLKSKQQDFEFSFEKDKLKATLNDPSDPRQGEESVEWINTGLESLWPMISPDIFRPVIDLLEDTLKTLAPGIVTTVRVEDLDQGRTPIRLVGFKTLDTEDPWVKNQVKLSDLPGEFINLEVEFVYRKKPEAACAHFVGYFGIGVQKIATCEMPVFVQIDGLHGKIKLRIQLIAVPPFVQTTTFSFSYLPEVEITARPMHGFNVMSLPLISHFIRSSVDVLLGNFCLPSSYTLDLSRILLGDDAAMRPRHVGVVAIAIHSASNLKITDLLNQTSDPYVSISFMKSASKPLFSTRIHFKDLNPVFEEIAFILITPDQLLEQERICLMICDSDRISSDDVLGKVDVDLQAMSKNAGIAERHESELSASFPGFSAQGSLTWSCAYFEFHQDFVSKEPMPFATQNPAEVSKEHNSSTDIDKSTVISPVVRPNAGIISIQIHSLAELQIRNMRHFRVHNQLKQHSRKLESDERNLPSTYCFVLMNDERIYETRVKKQTSDPYINSGVEHFVRDFDRTRIDIVVMEVRAREHDAIVGIVSIPLVMVLADQQQITKWWTLVGGNGSGKMRASINFQPVDVDVARPLCGWSVGVIEVFRIMVSGTSITNDMYYMKINVDCHSSHNSLNTDDASLTSKGCANELEWVFKPRMRLPVMSRMQGFLSMQLMKKATGKLALKDQAVTRPTLVWLSDVLDEEMVHFEIEMSPTEENPRRWARSRQARYAQQQTRKQVKIPNTFSATLPECHAQSHSRASATQASLHTSAQSVDGRGDGWSCLSAAVPSIAQKLEEHDRNKELENGTGPDDSDDTETETTHLSVSFRFVPGITKVHRALEKRDPGITEVYQTCQRAISSGERMRHPVLITTYESGSKSTTPNFPDETHHSERSLVNTNSPSSPLEQPHNATPLAADTLDKIERETLFSDFLSDSACERRVEIMDIDEAAEHWTDDDESASDTEADKSTNTSGASPQMAILKQKTHQLKEAITQKVIASRLNPKPNDESTNPAFARRRKAMKGESKEVYNLGPSKLKAVRTVKWMKDSAKVGIQRVRDSASHKTPTPAVQKEHISSF